MLNVVVISLPDAVARRGHAKEQLEGRSIGFEFFDAVKGGEAEHWLISQFDAMRFERLNGRSALPGELGCFVSHYLLWEQAARIQRTLLILEDDFEFCGTGTLDFDLFDRLSNTYGFIKLEPCSKKKPHICCLKTKEFQIVHYLKIPQSMTGYVISPTSAAQLVTKCSGITYPVDVYVRNHHMHHTKIYGFEPALIRASQREGFPSDIGNRRQVQAPLLSRIQYFLHRWSNAARNGFESLKYLIAEQVS